MPSSYTPQQKAQISQFAGFTSTKDSVAAKWIIIKTSEKRAGRWGRKKKKTLTEQLVDMGGFSYDSDSEQAILEELEFTDTRAPLQRSQVSLSDCEVFFGESCFWESTKRLFNSWLFRARRPHSWMEEKDLPMFFRFALRRPIMDERSFQGIMQTMNIQLESSTGNVRLPHTRPIGRSRQLLFGIDVDEKTNVHVSNKFKYALPKGVREDTDRASEEATETVEEDDEDMQQVIRRQLWTVYEHVRNGSVPLETATWHYRDAFDDQDMSDEKLVIRLETFGIPTDHVPASHRKASQGSVHSPLRGDVRSFEDQIGSIDKPHTDEKEIIKELVEYVRLFRAGGYHEIEVIPMIRHCLQGLPLESNTIEDILTDFDIDDEKAAELMWEDACEHDGSDSSDSLYASSSSSEDESQETDEAQETPLRAVIIPDPHAKEETDHDATVALAVDVIKSPSGSETGDVDYRGGFKQNAPEESEQISEDQSLTSRPLVDLGGLPTYSSANEVKRRALPPSSPRPNKSSLAKSDSQVDGQCGFEPPRGRSTGRRSTSSSPDEGMTTGMWGLLMPTKEARKLAHQMKLPRDVIDGVRSISPRKLEMERAGYAKTIVTFPKSKRKASMALYKDTPPKSPKYHNYSDIFAREGEDQETFVRSHFDPDEVLSRYTCMNCVQLPCECEDGSPPYPSSEPECSECLKQPCTCGHLSQLDQATQTSPPKAKPSHDAFNAKLVDRTRSNSPKQSDTLLAYLARVLDDNDVLASIKQLGEQAPADMAIADAKMILDHIQEAVHAGEKLNTAGDEDREAVRILHDIVNSSQKLTDYSEKLHHEVTGEDIPTSGDNGCCNGAVEGSDLESCLLNSSPSHENVPTPPSNPVASAAIFPETQLNIANGSILEANNTLLAKQVSTYLSTPAPTSSVPYPVCSSEIEDAVHSISFQEVDLPGSSAADVLSRAENHSGSPGRGQFSTAGGHAPKAERPAKSPAGSPLSPSTPYSEQVSDDSIDAGGDTDDTFGASQTRQAQATSGNTANNSAGTQPRNPPREGVRELLESAPSSLRGAGVQKSPDNFTSPSRRPSLENSPKRLPPPTRRQKNKRLSEKPQTTQEVDLFGPGFKTLELWPAGLPGKAGTAWMGMTPKKTLAFAKKEAIRQRKSFEFFMEERRAVRNCIKKENEYANSVWAHNSFFQNNSNPPSGSSGTATTIPLNKLFDKYRENPGEEPDKIGIEGQIRYLSDLGVKLDEVVVLAILTELSAPTMGEFTREGFISGWQKHRAETVPKQQGQVASFRRSLATTPDFFKRVYKQTFLIARLPSQKFVPLDTALEYWRLLFTSPSLSWNTATTPWLTYWLDYLESQWKKSVSKDMWDQTGVFAMKSLEDESMGWWSEDGAWPGVLDEFVFYVKGKRGNAAGGPESEMDVG